MSLITRLELEKSPLECLLDEINPNWKAGQFFRWTRDRMDKALDPAVLIPNYNEFSHRVVGGEHVEYKVDYNKNDFVVTRQSYNIQVILTNVEPQTSDTEIYDKNSVKTRKTVIEGMI